MIHVPMFVDEQRLVECHGAGMPFAERRAEPLKQLDLFLRKKLLIGEEIVEVGRGTVLHPGARRFDTRGQGLIHGRGWGRTLK